MRRINGLRRGILLGLGRSIRLPYGEYKDVLKWLFMDFFKVPGYWWSGGRRRKFVVSKEEFLGRYRQCTNGLLDGLKVKNLVLGGGSVVNLLSRDFDLSEQFDLDLFILRSPQVMDDVRATLIHFENVAKSKGVQVHYVIRGMLVEVLIPNERRVQVICTRYKTPEICLYCVDFAYVQMYYDGNSVYCSYLAMDALLRGHTTCHRLPLKSVRLEKARQKGFSIRPYTFSFSRPGSEAQPQVVCTEMDDAYTELLANIDFAKMEMDAHPTKRFQCEDGTLNLHYDAESCYKAFQEQMEYRWHVLRWLHHAQRNIFTDMDIFDNNMRLFSYNRHRPSITTKQLVSEDTSCEIVGQYIQDEFMTIVFITGQVTARVTTQGQVHVEPDEDMATFIQFISNDLQIDSAQDSCTHNVIEMCYHATGSRCYDSAERPMKISVDETVHCSISFTVSVVDKTRLLLEIVDVYKVAPFRAHFEAAVGKLLVH